MTSKLLPARRDAKLALEWLIDHDCGCLHPCLESSKDALQEMLSEYVLPDEGLKLRELDDLERAEVLHMLFGFLWARLQN